MPAVGWVTGEYTDLHTELREAILLRVTAFKSSWWRNPDFGADSGIYLGELVTPDTRDRLERAIRTELLKDSDRYTVEQINITTSGTTIHVQIIADVVEVQIDLTQ